MYQTPPTLQLPDDADENADYDESDVLHRMESFRHEAIELCGLCEYLINTQVMLVDSDLKLHVVVNGEHDVEYWLVTQYIRPERSLIVSTNCTNGSRSLHV